MMTRAESNAARNLPVLFLPRFPEKTRKSAAGTIRILINYFIFFIFFFLFFPLFFYGRKSLAITVSLFYLANLEISSIYLVKVINSY
ncbi:hypothetical protein PUN28_005379 [Cardiocondyla obscurior]|uniref:Uncharacterized protein n=1 Tax=Cardiocondyla obscurior TaxID=286306 RepID=A0AAW2GHI1_9HYME